MSLNQGTFTIDTAEYAGIVENFLAAISEHDAVIWSNVKDKLPPETELLGAGAGRLVISLPAISSELVVKIAIPQWGSGFASGTLQNALETHISEHQSALSGIHVPCLSRSPVGHRWGIYPMVEPENELEPPRPELQQAWQELEVSGFRTSDLFAQENWGWYQDQPYLLDYGYAHPDDDCRLVQSIAPDCQRWDDERVHNAV